MILEVPSKPDNCMIQCARVFDSNNELIILVLWLPRFKMFFTIVSICAFLLDRFWWWWVFWKYGMKASLTDIWNIYQFITMEINLNHTELHKRIELILWSQHDSKEGWDVRPGVTHFIMPHFRSVHTTVDDLKHHNWIIVTQDALPQGIVSAFPDVANNVPCHSALRNAVAKLHIMH